MPVGGGQEQIGLAMVVWLQAEQGGADGRFLPAHVADIRIECGSQRSGKLGVCSLMLFPAAAIPSRIQTGLHYKQRRKNNDHKQQQRPLASRPDTTSY